MAVFVKALEKPLLPSTVTGASAGFRQKNHGHAKDHLERGNALFSFTA